MPGWTDLGGEKLRWDGRLEDFYGGTIPKSAIIMWGGTLASIPNGWLLCDGTNGTPDLRDLFVRGASAGSGAGGTGGANTHTHSISGSTAAEASHTHAVGSLVTGTPSSTCTVSVNMATQAVASNTHTHAITGSTAAGSSHLHTAGTLAGDSCSNIPAYFALLFIQKA